MRKPEAVAVRRQVWDPPDPGLDNGETMNRMLMGIYQSAKEGREIRL